MSYLCFTLSTIHPYQGNCILMSITEIIKELVPVLLHLEISHAIIESIGWAEVLFPIVLYEILTSFMLYKEINN